MVFSSLLFLFGFLPAVLFFYFIVPKRYLILRNYILLLFSIGFYYCGEPKYVLLMLVSAAMNYTFGLIIHKLRLQEKRGSAILIIAVAANLLILVYFKYLSFLTENINTLFGTSFHIKNIIMPIGISFFTFQAMSYVFDVYNKTAEAQKNPANVALYISMFPQLIAGPIVRYETVSAEIKSRFSSLEDISEGVIRFIYGLGKKLILANAMGKIADEVFGASGYIQDGKVLWLGAVAYSFQIYFDFSGYSDMAIGLGKVFGFTFLENFSYPYISRSITEFWRRWHISLSEWFRDYVYIPLGGNRKGTGRQILNIFIIWFLTGFWHGAAWNFVVWGLYFAFILILEKTVMLKLLDKLPRAVSHGYALLLIVLGWVVFRTESLSGAFSFIQRMFSVQALTAPAKQVLYYLLEYRFELILSVIFSLPVGKLLVRKFVRYKTSNAYGVIRVLFVFFVFGLSILTLVNSSFNPFIYFRF